MKATKTMTTIAAAAMVSVIGLAYAQNSDSTLDPAATTQPAVVTDQMPAQTDMQPAPADPSTTVQQPEVNATDANSANSNGSQPAATGALIDNTATPAPTYSNPEPAAVPERAPRPDRN